MLWLVLKWQCNCTKLWGKVFSLFTLSVQCWITNIFSSLAWCNTFIWYKCMLCSLFGLISACFIFVKHTHIQNNTIHSDNNNISSNNRREESSKTLSCTTIQAPQKNFHMGFNLMNIIYNICKNLIDIYFIVNFMQDLFKCCLIYF